MNPPFDAAAKAHAKRIAAQAGKPGTQNAGLLAIHAVLHRKRHLRDEDAWSHFGAKRPRFYEWKSLITADAITPHFSLPAPPGDGGEPQILQPPSHANNGVEQQSLSRDDLQRELKQLDQRWEEVQGHLRELDSERLDDLAVHYWLERVVDQVDTLAGKDSQDFQDYQCTCAVSPPLPPPPSQPPSQTRVIFSAH